MDSMKENLLALLKLNPFLIPAWQCTYEEIADSLILDGVVVREKGEWVSEEVYPGVVSLNGYTCSECGKNTAKKANFCPNCGADMRERRE